MADDDESVELNYRTRKKGAQTCHLAHDKTPKSIEATHRVALLISKCDSKVAKPPSTTRIIHAHSQPIKRARIAKLAPPRHQFQLSLACFWSVHLILWSLVWIERLATAPLAGPGGSAASSNPQQVEGGNTTGSLALLALLALINLIVILGNLLVIVAVCATAKLRTATNIFIVSLATADLLLGVLVLPYALTAEVSTPSGRDANSKTKNANKVARKFASGRRFLLLCVT